jgi:MFS family permease
MATGVVLMASPLGMAVAAPLAERLGNHLGTGRLTALGLAMTAAGLGLLGMPSLGVAAMSVCMFVQGFGQGLFQVANFDLVTGTLPARDRGVAGSLALLTRTVGLMLGATLLMLMAQRVSGSGDLTAAGIEGAYRIAATLPAGLLVAAWWFHRR